MRSPALVDISKDFQTRSQRRRRRLLRVVIPVGCVVLMIVAIATIVAYAYQNNRRDALALSEDLLEALGRRIASEVHGYLNPASEMINLAVNIVQDPSFGITHRAKVAPLGTQILRNYPQLTIFSIADVNGNFVMLKKMPDGSFHTKVIERTEGAAQVTWIRRDTNGNIIAEEKSEDDSYDPRNRPWYQGAVKKSGVYWTDVYIFFTDQKPGVTASMPVFDRKGELKGVLGLDIELERLSAFLGNLKVGRTGQALIIDAQGRLVAYPDIGRMMKKEDEQLKPVMLDELEDPILSRALNRFRIEGHGTRRLTVNQRPFINIVSSLRSTVGRDWSIMIVAPEDDFVGFVKENSRTSMLMASVIIVLASILAGLLVFQGLRADRNAHLVLQRKQDIEAQSRAFSELSSQAALFDPADTDSLKQLTEIVATATAVRRSSIWHFADGGKQLLCDDSYDSESQGHTMGTTFERSQFRLLFEDLQKGKEIVVSDAEVDPRTKDLYSSYLHPLGCKSFLAVSMMLRGKTVGAVWLEHEVHSHKWDSEEISFVRAIAGMLALRLAAQQETEPTLSDPATGTHVAGESSTARTAPGRSSPQPRSTTQAIDKTLKSDHANGKHNDKGRATSFSDLMIERGYDQQRLGADVFPDATAFALRFTDPLLLAAPSGEDETQTTANHLVCHFEDMANSYGLDYWKIMNDQIIGAAYLGNNSHEHAQIIADIALNFQEQCAHLFADFDKQPAFRVGIDTAAVVGCLVGRRRRTYNIWGDAVQTAMIMAETGVTGGIHVSASTYQRLRAHYLFGVRGTYYLENIGEITTYLLTGRV